MSLCELLIPSGKYEEIGYAIHFTATLEEEYDKELFDRIGQWIENYFQNWAHTDVICMLVLSGFIKKGAVQPDDFRPWIHSPSKWKRRAVPVTFVEAVKAGHAHGPLLAVIKDLMEDDEEDVQKGLGTLLREIWKKEPAVAEDFLWQWKDTCGRKIVHYATEKMDKEYRKKFRREKK